LIRYVQPYATRNIDKQELRDFDTRARIRSRTVHKTQTDALFERRTHVNVIDAEEQNNSANTS